MPSFPPDVVAAVLAHMNTDHAEDNVVIVRAFAQPDAESALMTDLDTVGGSWVAVVDGRELVVHIDWTIPVIERADIRRAVTVMYRDACTKLGISPRLM